MPPGHLHLVVLASGRGSNFLAICAAIERGDLDAEIAVVISDRSSPVLAEAETKGLANVWINPSDYATKADYEKEIVRRLQGHGANLVVLAGYMRLVGAEMLQHYYQRILNIHPALLPSFPGLKAQKQALDYGVRFSGCSVHLVDAGMYTGPILAQTAVPVLEGDTEDILSQRILAEEHKLYFRVLQWLAEGRVYLDQRRTVIR